MQVIIRKSGDGVDLIVEVTVIDSVTGNGIASTVSASIQRMSGSDFYWDKTSTPSPAFDLVAEPALDTLAHVANGLHSFTLVGGAELIYQPFRIHVKITGNPRVNTDALFSDIILAEPPTPSDATLAKQNTILSDLAIVDGNVDDIEALLNVVDGKVDAIGIDVDTIDTATQAIQAKTDNLPDGIQKNTALANFPLVMVLTTDGRTPATSKTVLGFVSIDGAADIALGTVTEVGDGRYKVDLTGPQTNGDTLSFRFTNIDCADTFIFVVTDV